MGRHGGSRCVAESSGTSQPGRARTSSPLPLPTKVSNAGVCARGWLAMSRASAPTDRSLRRNAPSFFIDPWVYGLTFLKPCRDGPPTVSELRSRASMDLAGRGESFGSDSSSTESARSSVGVAKSLVSSLADASDEHVAPLKERRKLLKKLRQVAALREQVAAGHSLDTQQQVKLDSEPTLRTALADVERLLLSMGVALSPATQSDSEGEGPDHDIAKLIV
jgi:hypothetical protein